jgi:uncharacterized membrane protein
MKFELWHAFVIGAVLSWGIYVPVLHEGQTLIGGKPSAGAARAFLCVGIAYFVTAVLIPLLLFVFDLAGGEKLDFQRAEGTFNWGGATFALLAGVAGAAGALCIILSIKNGGKPLYIAPLVFAGAPIVNALVSLLWHPPQEGSPDWKFYTGIVLAALGAGLVLYSKAELDMKKPKPPDQARAAISPPATPGALVPENPQQ